MNVDCSTRERTGGEGGRCVKVEKCQCPKCGRMHHRAKVVNFVERARQAARARWGRKPEARDTSEAGLYEIE